MLGLGRCKTRQIAAAITTITTTTAAVAFLGNVAGATCFHVVIGNVAAIGGLVPDAVALDVGAGSLAGDCNVGALLVGFDHGVRGSWAGAAVDGVSGDGVCVDNGGEECEGEGHELEMHLDELDGEN